VHALGATLDPTELVRQASGSDPAPDAYLAHLQSRYL
jgi:Zn-dependent M32 family carboxypeptidase